MTVRFGSLPALLLEALTTMNSRRDWKALLQIARPPWRNGKVNLFSLGKEGGTTTSGYDGDMEPSLRAGHSSS